jgi:hypothetical protein
VSRRADYFALATLCLVVAGTLVAVAVGYYQIGAQLNPFTPGSLLVEPTMYPAYALGVLGTACILGGLLQWPLPPWRRPTFPDVRIEFSKIARHDEPIDDSSFDRWWWARILVTNKEMETSANLTFRLRMKLDPATSFGEKFRETLFTTPPDRDPPAKVPIKWATNTVHIRARQSIDFDFLACVHAPWTAMLADPGRIALIVEDQVTQLAIVVNPFAFSIGREDFVFATMGEKKEWLAFPDVPNNETSDAIEHDQI